MQITNKIKSSIMGWVALLNIAALFIAFYFIFNPSLLMVGKMLLSCFSIVAFHLFIEWILDDLLNDKKKGVNTKNWLFNEKLKKQINGHNKRNNSK